MANVMCEWVTCQHNVATLKDSSGECKYEGLVFLSSTDAYIEADEETESFLTCNQYKPKR